MGVMMLAASRAARSRIETIGTDEEAAMNALTALIEDKFGEGE
jgi:phosphocarrier protein HPr